MYSFFLNLASFINYDYLEIYLFGHISIVYFYCCFSIALDRYKTICLAIHLVVAIWIVFSFEQWQIQLFHILLYTVLYEQMPSFLSHKYLRVDWPDHMIIHMFNFSRNCWPVFQRGLTTLYSCQLQIGT